MQSRIGGRGCLARRPSDNDGGRRGVFYSRRFSWEKKLGGYARVTPVIRECSLVSLLRFLLWFGHASIVPRKMYVPLLNFAPRSAVMVSEEVARREWGGNGALRCRSSPDGPPPPFERSQLFMGRPGMAVWHALVQRGPPCVISTSLTRRAHSSHPPTPHPRKHTRSLSPFQDHVHADYSEGFAGGVAYRVTEALALSCPDPRKLA